MGRKRSPMGSPGADERDKDGEQGSSDEAQRPQCHHVKKAVDVNRVRKALQAASGRVCCECERNETAVAVAEEPPWLCLTCGATLCGSDVGGHALRHYEVPRSESHALVLQTRTWTIHCHSCGRRVKPAQQSNRKLHDCLDQLRRVLDSSSPPGSKSPEPSVSRVASIPSANLYSSSNSTVNRRVRGITNLGNTCYFNSVMQCLAQTPYLLAVLKDMLKSGEKIRLPGGNFTPKPPPPDPDLDEPDQQQIHEIQLPAIRGELRPMSAELCKGGNLTRVLADALQELQAAGKCDVFSPSKLLNEFVKKVPQFDGGEQHDSHELLRHLLEAVRSDDLRRYQEIVLQHFDARGKNKNEIDDLTKQKLKFYGQQAADSMLRPGQVFRGLLVSTLECQDCKHSSHTTEYFLDLSLPITADKPQPPAITRRKMLDEQTNTSSAPENEKSKHQLKKERKAARKAHNMNSHNSMLSLKNRDQQTVKNALTDEDNGDDKLENKSSSEQSDADVEDNVDDNTNKPKENEAYTSLRGNEASVYCMESGYNSEKVAASDSTRESPIDLENKEKSDLSPERTDKDLNQDIYPNSIPLPYKPMTESVDSPQVSNPDSGVASPETAKRALSDDVDVESLIKELGSPTSLSSEMYMDMSSPRRSNNSPVLADSDNLILRDPLGDEAHNSEKLVPDGDYKTMNWFNPPPNNYVEFDRSFFNNDYDLSLNNLENNADNNSNNHESNELPKLASPDFKPPKWKKETSPFINRNSGLSQRNLCDEGEYSIQSCLNQFTSSELLTGNNKVGCEACTKRANNNKTVYTNATKRFCISSPPAVLILHLKRFQLGSRCILRKITKTVNFPLILDLAPFCSEKARNPNGAANPNKMLYSLYGVVEHFGNTLHLGHYVAYVKVRPEITPGDSRYRFLPPNIHKDDGDDQKSPDQMNGSCNDNDTDSSLSGYESGEGAVGCSEVEAPTGKWYSISDSRVTEVSEEEVLKVQAYLLFYERIL